MILDITTLLTSSVLAGLIAALVSLRASERKISIENITQERAKWRTAMRELTDSIAKAVIAKDTENLRALRIQLALDLNPLDSEDHDILTTVEKLIQSIEAEELLSELTERMSLLLKHDWERAKFEAKPWRYQNRSPQRVKYCEFKCSAISTLQQKSNKSHALPLTGYFSMMMLAAGILFFFAAGFTEPFQKLVLLFNDPKTEKPAGAWAQFVMLSLYVGFLWTTFYLWFKGCEKKFLEIWFSQKS